MSYDLFAQAFKAGGADDRDALRPNVLEVVRPFVVLGSEDEGFCRTRTPDGGEAQFFLGESGAHFMVNHFAGGETTDLIYRAAAAAGLVLLGGELPPVLTERSQLRELPQDLLSSPWQPAVLIESGRELEALIAGDQEAFRFCRKRLLANG